MTPRLAEAWDSWLSLLTQAVREAAGDAWPKAWLTAPLWHFALGADLVPAPGAAGVLIASVDRVGRMFPFTVIGPASGIPGDAWADTVEALALDALDDDFDPNALDAALTALGSPPVAAPLDPNQSLWRCRGSERVDPTCRLVTGFPDRRAAPAMVLG